MSLKKRSERPAGIREPGRPRWVLPSAILRPGARNGIGSAAASIVSERVEYVAEVFSAYDAVLESAPEHLPTMQAYARLAVRDGRHDEKVEAMVRAIALRGEDEAWRSWAREQISQRR
jgi:hypothetical protein